MLVSYVYDCLFAGNKEFEKQTLKMEQKLDAEPVEWYNVEFLEVHMHKKRKTDQLWFEISQLDYIDKLRQIQSNATFEEYRSTRARFSWPCHTRPDICRAINRASQVTEEKFQKGHIRALNKII